MGRAALGALKGAVILPLSLVGLAVAGLAAAGLLTLSLPLTIPAAMVVGGVAGWIGGRERSEHKRERNSEHEQWLERARSIEEEWHREI